MNRFPRPNPPNPKNLFKPNPRTIALLALCFAAVHAASAQPPAQTTDLIDATTAKNLDQWHRFYVDLHQHPELSLKESRSADKIAAELKTLGYTVTSRIGGQGLVGVLKNGTGPTVLIRGDMDALPVTEQTGLPYASNVQVENPDGSKVGVMHACGHDIHQTCLVATARVLAELKDQWRGTLLILAQPAEEIGRGAKMMIQDGLFERFPKPDYCLALHVSADLPAGEIGYTPGWAMANVDSVDITIFGQGGHGSRPDSTIDPIVTAAYVITSLQTIVSRNLDPVEPGVITVGSIHGGAKHNIIPDEVHLQLTVRSYTDETRSLLLDGIERVTIQTCRAMGCPRDPFVHIRRDEFTPASYNDPELTERAVAVMRGVVGADHVKLRKARMGGEDFGRFSKHLNRPGFMFSLGSVARQKYQAAMQPGGEPLPSLHSSKYAPDPKPTIRTGVRCMSAVALSLFNQPPAPR